MAGNSVLEPLERPRFAYRFGGAYHGVLMAQLLRRLSLAVLLALLLPGSWPVHADDSPATIPVTDIKPGMKGVAYTIFQGDQVEKVDLEVIGILHNAVGPQLDVILVRLLGDKVQQTGVVAGMSGSPVYFDGKLAGALALKLGQFTREAIGGVTPIADMYEIEKSPASSGTQSVALVPPRVDVPQDLAARTSVGAGQYLVPIETPLVTAGLYPETLAMFGKNFSAWGMSAMAGGNSPASPDDAELKPGDMVGIDLVEGDLSISSGCSVTTVIDNRILACGHPLFGFGSVQMPLSRAHVIMTLSSAQASTKIMSTGGTIGTLTQDRQTAVMGQLGPGPAMIPIELTLDTPAEQKKYHFKVVESPQLTPTLVATAAFNGIVGSPAYGEGTTLQMDGEIAVKGHTSVKLEDLFAPTDQSTPVAFYMATTVMSDFSRIYSNPYELPQIDHVDIHVKSIAEKRWATIDNAWVDHSEVRPGESLSVKVLLRPYRGAPFVQEIPVTIPAQATRGSLQMVVSGADFLNRNVQSLAATSQGQLPGLEELIQLTNRERHNDRVYATLLQSTPTMLVEDKELPNVPISAINVLDQRQNSGNARLLLQSTAGEWSVEMHQVIAGQRMLTITVK
jgi:hypothetical protein